MDSDEIIWNLKRLIREAFPKGMHLSLLESNYKKYFQPAAFPKPNSLESGCQNWHQVFNKSDKFRKWFHVGSSNLIHVRPVPERDLLSFFRLVRHSQYLAARQGAKVEQWSGLSESESEDDPFDLDNPEPRVMAKKESTPAASSGRNKKAPLSRKRKIETESESASSSSSCGSDSESTSASSSSSSNSDSDSSEMSPDSIDSSDFDRNCRATKTPPPKKKKKKKPNAEMAPGGSGGSSTAINTPTSSSKPNTACPSPISNALGLTKRTMQGQSQEDAPTRSKSSVKVMKVTAVPTATSLTISTIPKSIPPPPTTASTSNSLTSSITTCTTISSTPSAAKGPRPTATAARIAPMPRTTAAVPVASTSAGTVPRTASASTLSAGNVPVPIIPWSAPVPVREQAPVYSVAPFVPITMAATASNYLQMQMSTVPYIWSHPFPIFPTPRVQPSILEIQQQLSPLMYNSVCILCNNTKLRTFLVRKDHYNGKGHETALRAWLSANNIALSMKETSEYLSWVAIQRYDHISRKFASSAPNK